MAICTKTYTVIGIIIVLSSLQWPKGYWQWTWCKIRKRKVWILTYIDGSNHDDDDVS